MSARQSGIRHALDYAKRARRQLEAGRLGPALQDWYQAGSHLSFTVGLTETSDLSLAVVLLRKGLQRLGGAIERQIAARVEPPGWLIAEPVVEAFSDLTERHGVPPADITDRAARAAVAVVQRWIVSERQ